MCREPRAGHALCPRGEVPARAHHRVWWEHRGWGTMCLRSPQGCSDLIQGLPDAACKQLEGRSRDSSAAPPPRAGKGLRSAHRKAQWKAYTIHSKPDHWAMSNYICKQTHGYVVFFRKAIWQHVSISLKTFLPFNLLIAFLGIHIEEMIRDDDRDVYTKVALQNYL